mmetsp:Transcript_78571/g.151800  ORF Transcript_78571/g.151800 Transcript_78571/m.151800 type:complete len:186 (+) Transcript_78571:634-1191(+)
MAAEDAELGTGLGGSDGWDLCWSSAMARDHADALDQFEVCETCETCELREVREVCDGAFEAAPTLPVSQELSRKLDADAPAESAANALAQCRPAGAGGGNGGGGNGGNAGGGNAWSLLPPNPPPLAETEVGLVVPTALLLLLLLPLSLTTASETFFAAWRTMPCQILPVACVSGWPELKSSKLPR